MKATTFLLIAGSFGLAWIAGASAQGDPDAGGTSADGPFAGPLHLCPADFPCLWFLTLDADGFVWNTTDPYRPFQDGSQVMVWAFNNDTVQHNVSIPGVGFYMEVPPGGFNVTESMQWSGIGFHDVFDEPSGDTYQIVLAPPRGSGIPVPWATDEGGDAEDTPAPRAAALLLIGVLAAARRRFS